MSAPRKLIASLTIAGALCGAIAMTVLAGAATRSGGPGANVIVGTSSADQLSGGGGNDTIRAKGGDDTVKGGRGRDKIKAGSGNDSVRGGSGKDKVVVRDGEVDAVECGAGKRDKVKGDADTDAVSGCERGSSGLARFADHVELSIEGDYLLVETNGLPDHETGSFPNASNPNSISAQDFSFALPLEPELASSPTDTGGGAIGVTLSGAPFYNPYNAGGLDAVVVETFDDCEGHPDPSGTYHYHQYSDCIYDDGRGHSEVWGYAFDGFAVYGPDGAGGGAPTDLDQCNGHSHGKRGYHYHASEDLPYLIGCYSGVVEQANIQAPGGPPMSAGVAGGMIAVPLLILGGALALARRRGWAAAG